MENKNILIADKEKIISFIQFIFLLSLATLVPLFHQQMITGPIINATLFIAVLLLGSRAALLVGLLPSVIALSIGLLPAILVPMIPFIITGNCILVLAFGFLKDKNYWLAIITASLLKFIFLFSTSSIVINLLLKKTLAPSILTMMSWPQLLTALFGGILAYGFFTKFYKK